MVKEVTETERYSDGEGLGVLRDRGSADGFRVALADANASDSKSEAAIVIAPDLKKWK